MNELFNQVISMR